jgi:hypothetical protein
MAPVWQELKRRNVVRVAIAYLVAAWLLLQVTSEVVPILDLPAWVPRFVLLSLAIGFVPTVIFAWAFELTPEGVKKEEDVDRSRSTTRVTGRRLDFVIIGLLAIAVVYFILERPLPTGTEQEIDRSVAVLPFVPLSSGEDDGYFADGLTEQILWKYSVLRWVANSFANL